MSFVCTYGVLLKDLGGHSLGKISETSCFGSAKYRTRQNLATPASGPGLAAPRSL